MILRAGILFNRFGRPVTGRRVSGEGLIDVDLVSSGDNVSYTLRNDCPGFVVILLSNKAASGIEIYIFCADVEPISRLP